MLLKHMIPAGVCSDPHAKAWILKSFWLYDSFCVHVKTATQAHNLKHKHSVTVFWGVLPFQIKVKLPSLPPIGSHIELQLTLSSQEGFW